MAKKVKYSLEYFDSYFKGTSWRKKCEDKAKEGGTIYEICADILDISYRSVRLAIEKDRETEEFFDKLDTLGQAWLDKTGRENLTTKDFNNVLYVHLDKKRSLLNGRATESVDVNVKSAAEELVSMLVSDD